VSNLGAENAATKEKGVNEKMNGQKNIPGIIQGMKIRTYKGILDHKNPTCEVCQGNCFALYRGGKKERMQEIFFCKNCSILYELPLKKKCTFTEVKN